MEPSKKSPEIDQMITDTFGIDRQKSIREGVCAWCKKPALEFRDQESIDEYKISGYCQVCQDEVWPPC